MTKKNSLPTKPPKKSKDSGKSATPPEHRRQEIPKIQPYAPPTDAFGDPMPDAFSFFNKG